VSTRESVTCRCQQCGHRFRVLADEVGMHDCPRCGHLFEEEPPEAEEQENEEDEEESEASASAAANFEDAIDENLRK
jgi:predicted  nucleic acid-binding Zn-ribbon protein